MGDSALCNNLSICFQHSLATPESTLYRCPGPTSTPTLIPDPAHQAVHEAGHVVHEQGLQLLQGQGLHITLPGCILVEAVDDLEEGFLHWGVCHDCWALAPGRGQTDLEVQGCSSRGQWMENLGEENSTLSQPVHRWCFLQEPSTLLYLPTFPHPVSGPQGPCTHLTPCKRDSKSLPCKKLS